jgi:hypothetical protein
MAGREQGRCPDLGDDHRSLRLGFTLGLVLTSPSAPNTPGPAAVPRTSQRFLALWVDLTINFPMVLVTVW